MSNLYLDEMLAQQHYQELLQATARQRHAQAFPASTRLSFGTFCIRAGLALIHFGSLLRGEAPF
jgi:hypothetical protein